MATLNADVTDVATISQISSDVGGFLGSANALSLGIFGIMTHGEVEYGKGTISIEGGFLGLEGKISDNVTTYTLKEEHHNVSFIEHLNYSYKLSWFSSEYVNQAQNTYNGYVNNINGYTGDALSLPPLAYKITGLDADIGLGWNVLDNGENDYLSIGLDVGLSTPMIEATQLPLTSGDSSSSASTSGSSSTKMKTYKIGPQIKIAKTITPWLWLYASAIYAYQKASIKNSSIGLDSNVRGRYLENELGIMFRPIRYSYQLTDWFSLSPKLYGSLGIRYNEWIHDKTTINLYNQELLNYQGDLKVNTMTTYVGVGYSF